MNVTSIDNCLIFISIRVKKLFSITRAVAGESKASRIDFGIISGTTGIFLVPASEEKNEYLCQYLFFTPKSFDDVSSKLKRFFTCKFFFYNHGGLNGGFFV